MSILPETVQRLGNEVAQLALKWIREEGGILGIDYDELHEFVLSELGQRGLQYRFDRMQSTTFQDDAVILRVCEEFSPPPQHVVAIAR